MIINFIVHIMAISLRTLIKLTNILYLLFIAFFYILYAIPLEAKVTGNCSNCHTMHNSQRGQTMVILGPGETDTSPRGNLLRSTCIGCHSKTDSTTWKDSITGAPIVFNTTEPSYNSVKGLSAGNFFYVQTDDDKGHNIFSNNPDDKLDTAPGGTNPNCGTQSCHDNLHASNTDYGFRQGCSKCNMMKETGPQGFHHKNNPSSEPLVKSADDGWYRFLSGHQTGDGHGVSGLEDANWQKDPTSSIHNEYLGYSGSKTSAGGFSSLGDTITAYCTGCHGNFHVEQSSNVWIRHPSDSIIPDRGEFSNAFGAIGGIGTYDPLVPVARPSIDGWTEPKSTVELNSDLVMCLSCHRAHASPYFKMLRWDYKSWPGNGGTNGCTVCHTSKN
jgi:hypothetical protein